MIIIAQMAMIIILFVQFFVCAIVMDLVFDMTIIFSQVAMIISAIVFAQTSILNFTYFLSTALPLVGVQLG